MKPKSVENYTGMESEEPFGDEMPNCDVFGTVFKELFKDIDVLDVDAKTETAASSENSKWKRACAKTQKMATEETPRVCHVKPGLITRFHP